MVTEPPPDKPLIPKESAFNMIYGTLVGIALFVVIVILCWMLSTKLERDKQRKKREEIVSSLGQILTVHFRIQTVILECVRLDLYSFFLFMKIYSGEKCKSIKKTEQRIVRRRGTIALKNHFVTFGDF